MRKQDKFFLKYIRIKDFTRTIMGGRQRCWVLGVGVVTDEKMWYKFVCECVCVCSLLQVLIIVSRILLLPW